MTRADRSEGARLSVAAIDDPSIEEMSRDELILELESLDNERARISEKLKGIKSRARSGYFTDPAWRGRLQERWESLGRERMRVQARLSLDKQERWARFERRFIDAAFRILDKETYARILKEAGADPGAGSK